MVLTSMNIKGYSNHKYTQQPEKLMEIYVVLCRKVIKTFVSPSSLKPAAQQEKTWKSGFLALNGWNGKSNRSVMRTWFYWLIHPDKLPAEFTFHTLHPPTKLFVETQEIFLINLNGGNFTNQALRPLTFTIYFEAASLFFFIHLPSHQLIVWK